MSANSESTVVNRESEIVKNLAKWQDAYMREVLKLGFGLGDTVTVEGKSWEGYTGKVTFFEGDYVTLAVEMGKAKELKSYRVKASKCKLFTPPAPAKK